jgi:hypothetical protein
VLFKAAEQSDCVAHLALVTLWQHGTAECDWEPYSYGGGYRSGWSGDDGDGAGDEYEMGYIFDTSLSADDARLPLSRLIDHALRSRNKYKLTGTHLAAISTLEPRLGRLTAHNKAISYWLASCRQMLQARTDVVPQDLADFRRVNKLSCSCSDCSELSRFLADPDQCEKRMKLNKNRRRHLHDIIRSERCDLTHVTERYGRPFTLVCTKTTASYQRACKIHERDLSNLSRIEYLENRIV